MRSGCGDCVRADSRTWRSDYRDTADRWHLKTFIACKHGEVGSCLTNIVDGDRLLLAFLALRLDGEPPRCAPKPSRVASSVLLWLESTRTQCEADGGKRQAGR